MVEVTIYHECVERSTFDGVRSPPLTVALGDPSKVDLSTHRDRCRLNNLTSTIGAQSHCLETVRFPPLLSVVVVYSCRIDLCLTSLDDVRDVTGHS